MVTSCGQTLLHLHLRKDNPNPAVIETLVAAGVAVVVWKLDHLGRRPTRCPNCAAKLGIRPVTLYRYVGPQGQLREQGQKVLAS